jgi:sulfotransferase family protein
MTAFTSNYSPLDRFLHRLAFSGIELQKALADIEDRMHAARLRGIAADRPVFITSLPRAGTTLLLDLVAALPGFTSHTYRSMPFVLCPLLWDSISQNFHRQSTTKERAHGDGMSVGYDSPEAFEEVIWKAFWPQKFSKDGIALWTAADRDAEFEEFLRSHMKKLIALSGSASARYVSKNNANIARLPLLREIFPEAAILIPFRDPVDQASSLFRQHTRFSEMHRNDAFARWYMEAIGHYEFGAGLRPVAFPCVLDVASDPAKGDFWLATWINAYSYLLSQDDLALSFVEFDRMCADPVPTVRAIAKALDIDDPASLQAGTTHLHPAIHYDPAATGLDPVLVAQARIVQEELRNRALH